MVEGQPEPPRQVPLWPLVKRSYANRPGRILTACGLVLGLPLIAAGIATRDQGVFGVLLLLFSVTYTILFVSAPSIRAWRLARALKIGVVADAVVVRSMYSGPRLRPETIDAQVSGFARGTWRVTHPGRDAFEAPFESDAPWASKLRKGARARVLIPPDANRVLVDLGPAA